MGKLLLLDLSCLTITIHECNKISLFRKIMKSVEHTVQLPLVTCYGHLKLCNSENCRINSSYRKTDGHYFSLLASLQSNQTGQFLYLFHYFSVSSVKTVVISDFLHLYSLLEAECPLLQHQSQRCYFNLLPVLFVIQRATDTIIFIYYLYYIFWLTFIKCPPV